MSEIESKPEPIILEAAADITHKHLEHATEIHDSWFADYNVIDWETFIDRFVDPDGFNKYNLPPFDIENMDNPAVRKIQMHVRHIRNYDY